MNGRAVQRTGRSRRLEHGGEHPDEAGHSSDLPYHVLRNARSPLSQVDKSMAAMRRSNKTKHTPELARDNGTMGKSGRLGHWREWTRMAG
nr:hypothetical protein CFP56_20530 [Quercus suber]